MVSLLSSPARLIDPVSIEYLKDHLCEHGALGTRRAMRSTALSELEKFQLVPLVFGFIPRAVCIARPPDQPIKPLITAHLHGLGVSPDAVLLDVLKSVCDQFWDTRRDNNARSMRPKFGMRDIRARRTSYMLLLERQNRRCTLCGTDLRLTVETLDHVVPFRLIGDVPDGSNWEIQCEPCNNSKGHYMSSLQALQAHNWIYSSAFASLPLDTPSSETRFLVLAQRRRCAFPGCDVTARTGQLFIRKARATGLAIADNLVVRCFAHITT